MSQATDAPAILILAGGASSRMGSDKALLRLPDGRTCLQTLLDMAGTVTGEILLGVDTQLHADRVLRDCAEPLPAVLLDQQPGRGPLAVLTRALRVARAPAVLALAVDMPLISASLLHALHTALLGTKGTSYDAAVPLIDGVPQPLCACYATRLAPTAEALLRAGQRGPRALLATAGVSVRWVAESELCHVEPGLRSFLSANTPEQWTRLLARAASARDSGNASGNSDDHGA
jgi:molybdopterin-guanine dinucleotide biosynthesis protein A